MLQPSPHLAHMPKMAALDNMFGRIFGRLTAMIPRIQSGAKTCSRGSIRARPSRTRARRATLIQPRPPNGSTRSNPSFESRAASGRNSCYPRSTARRRISASYPTYCPSAPIGTRSRPKSRVHFPATSTSRPASRRSFAGMRWRWSCARTPLTASSAGTSRATPPPPRFSRSASIISSAGRTANRAAMSSFSSRTRPPASMRAPSSKAVSPRRSWSVIGRRSAAPASHPIPIPG